MKQLQRRGSLISNFPSQKLLKVNFRIGESKKQWVTRSQQQTLFPLINQTKAKDNLPASTTIMLIKIINLDVSVPVERFAFMQHPEVSTNE